MSEVDQSPNAARPAVAFIDARALQDDNYRERGVGQHSASLLDSLRGHDWGGARPRMVALTDPAMPALSVAHRRLFDEIWAHRDLRRAHAAAGRAGGAWLIGLSPMTHDPAWLAAFLTDPAVYRVALFYDLIPLDYPARYLAAASARLDYVQSLAWLRSYNAFAAISRHSGDRLVETLGIDPARVFVSGVAVRPALIAPAGAARPAWADRHTILVAGGGDARKNPECVLLAHARSKPLRAAGTKVAVFGNYGGEQRGDLRGRYVKAGGRTGDLRFVDHVDDAALHALYRDALVTVVPSEAEGFSIPIVESGAAGTPVLASDVGAHPELVDDPAWRFDPAAPAALGTLLERLATSPDDWTALAQAQQDRWRDYTVEQVGARFLAGVIERMPPAPAAPSAPSLGGIARPALAVLSPLPPARSGVGNYTAVTLAPLAAVADLHFFTPTRNATPDPRWASLRSAGAIRFTRRSFDATLSVIGNSDHHSEIYDYLVEHGGASIVHDARQLGFYAWRFGIRAAALLGSRELGRPVSEQDIDRWLNDQGDLPTPFMSEIVAASDPMIVHSAPTAAVIEAQYGKRPDVLPFALYDLIDPDLLRPARRDAIRAELGFDSDEIVIASFGFVSADKSPADILWAAYFLREWGYRPRLVFVGAAERHVKAQLRRLERELKLRNVVTYHDEMVDSDTYRRMLAAADVAVQLRTHFMGQLSGAIADCVGAALPTVASASLAEAMESPDFVARVPDGRSAVLIAERIAGLIEDGAHLSRPFDVATAFVAAHSPRVYSRRLAEVLGLDIEIR